MQITELRIRKVENEGKLRAYVTVTFDNCFVVHNVKIIEGQNGLFIAMPSRKTANGEYKDVAHLLLCLKPYSLQFYRGDIYYKTESKLYRCAYSTSSAYISCIILSAFLE